MVERIRAGTDPEQFSVAPDGTLLYASNEDAGTASVTDVATGDVLATLIVVLPVCFIFGMLVGLPALRIKGLYLALTTLGLAALGVNFHEAETGVMLLAFLLFLGLFLWTFAAQSMVKVWVVFAGGAVVMTGAALAIQHMLVG